MLFILLVLWSSLGIGPEWFVSAPCSGKNAYIAGNLKPVLLSEHNQVL